MSTCRANGIQLLGRRVGSMRSNLGEWDSSRRDSWSEIQQRLGDIAFIHLHTRHFREGCRLRKIISKKGRRAFATSKYSCSHGCTPTWMVPNSFRAELRRHRYKVGGRHGTCDDRRIEDLLSDEWVSATGRKVEERRCHGIRRGSSKEGLPTTGCRAQ
jgi:hypothetical protein